MIKNISKEICLTLFLTASIQILSSAAEPGNLEALNSISTERRNSIGIEISTATGEQKAAAMEYKEGGVYITAVIVGHPASHAGLMQGDIISTIHSVPVNEASEFLMALNNLEAGRKYPFRIHRRTEKGAKILEINILIEKVQEREMGKVC